MPSHTKERPHKCQICPATFGRPDCLREHVKRIHQGIKQIKQRNSQCQFCSYKCYDKSMLQRHLGKHSAELPFSCDIPSCGFKTKSKNDLLRHDRTVHNDQRSFECPTDGCNYKGKTMGQLRRHLKIHSNENTFTCTVSGCAYTTNLRKYLKAHISRAHSVEKPFKCSTCDYRTKSKSSLHQHQLTHIKVKRFQCQAPNCGFASHHEENLKRHFDAKHRTKDVRCTEPGCSYTCGSILLLNRHLKIHGKPMLKCPSDSCNFSTRFKASLLKHMSRHHSDLLPAMGVGQGMSYVEIAATASAMETLHCHFSNCDYQTKRPHHFDRHMVTHKKEENRHVCPFCFSRFSVPYTLKDHVRRHIGEKPYSCSFCNYTAVVDSSEIGNHARRHHHIHVIPRVEGDILRKCHTCGKTCWGYYEFVLHTMAHLQPVVVLQRLSVHVL